MLMMQCVISVTVCAWKIFIIIIISMLLHSPGKSDVKESSAKIDHLFTVTYFIVCPLNGQ